MSRIKIIALCFVLAGVYHSCKKQSAEPESTPKVLARTKYAPAAIQSSNQFGIDLFKKVAEDDNLNLMLSPLSASTALTMLLNGCGGEPFSQLQGALGYPAEMTISDINEAYKSLVEQLLNADPKVKLSLANAIFYRNEFTVKPPLLNTNSNDFLAMVSG